MAFWERRAEVGVGERGAELARPGDGLVSQQAREEVELLLEQLLVVGEVESEERERLRQRTATDDELRTAVRDRVEGGELGVHPNGILRAQHGDGGAEPDAFGSPRDRSQDHVRRGVHHVAAVVLGDVERVDPDSVGENRLLDRVADDDVAAEFLTGLVHGDGNERVQSELDLRGGHLCVLASSVRAGVCQGLWVLGDWLGQRAAAAASPKNSPYRSTIRSRPLTSAMVSGPTIPSCPGN